MLFRAFLGPDLVHVGNMAEKMVKILSDGESLRISNL